MRSGYQNQAAIPIDRSIFPFLARRMALLCSAAFPTIPIIIAPTNNSPNPNSAVTTSIDPTRISLITITPAILNPSKRNDLFLLHWVMISGCCEDDCSFSSLLLPFLSLFITNSSSRGLKMKRCLCVKKVKTILAIYTASSKKARASLRN